MVPIIVRSVEEDQFEILAGHNRVKAAKEAGLPLPKYTWNDPYLVLTLFPNHSSSTASLPEETLNSLSNTEQAGWQWLTTKGRTTSTEYANANSVDARTARRHLRDFMNQNLVRMVGSGPTTEYEVI